MKIYVLNTLSIGEDSIELLSRGIDIIGVIGLSNREPGDAISDFAYQKVFCDKQKLKFIEIDDYSLNNLAAREKISSIDIDVLIVTGWQRLVPEWLINHCQMCVIGSHGSPFGITKGRGRSPQNWSLIMGLTSFEISIFKIDKGIDSGVIFDTKKFNYDENDDIRTSYFKVCLLTSSMIINLLKDKNFLSKDFLNQEESEAEYLPKRTPEDGFIDWNRTGKEIGRFVRALTRPYPGARTKINDTEIIVWKGQPFKININLEGLKNGQVYKVFNNGDVLVKCASGLFLITNYSSNIKTVEIKNSDVFSSFNHSKINKNILNRHNKVYPGLTVSSKLIDYFNKL